MALRRALGLAAAAMVCLSAWAGRADELHLRMPASPNNTQQYFYDLLSEAMQAAGHPVSIELIAGLPPPRIPGMLTNGDVDAYYFLQTLDRDHSFIPVPVQLTDGLFGERIMFIAQGDQPLYDRVGSLADFKGLGRVGAAGKGWIDVLIWHANGLPVYEHRRNWANLYAMIGSRRRGIDYMTRGVNEIEGEKTIGESNGLAIERHLLLTYDKDAIFYVSPKRPELAPLLLQAMQQARAQGIIHARATTHWAADIRALDLADRVKIKLQTPEQIAAGGKTP
jgi:hypothetical protein